MVGGKFVTPHFTSVCKISKLCGAISLLAFKLGKFTNFKALFSSSVDEYSLTGLNQNLKRKKKSVSIEND